jgi:surface antigen
VTRHRFGPSTSWRYNRVYHDRYASRRFVYSNRFCQADGDSVLAGALLGAIFGGVIGDGDAGAYVAGGLVGAGFGAAISDCDRGQYRYALYSAVNNNQPYYWGNPHSGVRGVVYARDYHSWSGRQCRWGDAEIFLPNGELVYDRVRMCRDRYGRWEVAGRQ